VCQDSVNSFFNYDASAIAVHFQDLIDEKRVFLVSSSPAKVTEYDVNQFRNHYIQKIFISQEGVSKRFVGQSQIAVNRDQIMHLLRDVYNDQFVIRVYSRTSSFYSMILHDIRLPPQSRSPFFTFPNYYLNKILFRDERTVNIT